MSENKAKDLLNIIIESRVNKKLSGSLSKYANPSLIDTEDRGWKEHVEEKHRV